MTYFGMVTDLLGGLMVSVEIFAFTLLIALPLGFPIALGRMSKNPVVSGFFSVYISVVRGTPLMLQIIFVYFAPYILFGLPLSNYPRLLATVFAFGLNYAAYFAEIYRGGIQSIDRGQTEAARSLGLSASQTMLRIILPQAFKNVLPAMCNEFVAITKETSLASTFYVGDLMTQYQTISGKTYLVIEPLVIIGVIYFVVTFTMSKLIAVLERRLKSGD